MRLIRLINGKTAVCLIVAAILAAVVMMLFFGEAEKNGNKDLSSFTKDFISRIEVADPRYSIWRDSLENCGDDDRLYRLLGVFGRKMFENGDQIKAFGYLRQCLVLMEENDRESPSKREFIIRCHLLLGAAADEVGLRSLSHEYYFRGLKMTDRHGVGIMRGDFLNNIGVSLMRAGKTDEANEYFLKAEKEAERCNNRYLLSIIYNNLSEIAARERHYDKAIDLALKALNFLDHRRQQNDYYSMENSIGGLYLIKGETELAESYVRNAYRHHLSNGNNMSLFESCILLARAFEYAGVEDSVTKYVSEAAIVANKTENPIQRQRVIQFQADREARNGNTAEAMELERDILALKDSIYNEENASRIRESNEIYNIERESINSEKGILSWNPVVVFSSMGCLVLSLCVALALVIVMKRRNETLNIQKREAMEDYAAIQQRLLDEEIEKSRIIKEDLDFHHQKLTSFTLSHIKTNQKVESVELKLKRMLSESSPRDKGLRDDLRNMISMLSSVKTDTHWDEFQYYFDKVHPYFYDRLDKLHPGLTPKDRRLCALISLGLSSKEIAGITFREVRSVETSRTRLRKKMGLDSEENLFDYIIGLTHT